MAPMAPMGKARLLAYLGKGQLPLQFGAPHPTVAVVVQAGMFRVRELVVDEGEADAARTLALASHGSWMPEHYYGLGKPIGRTFLEAPTLEELRIKIEALEPWPRDW